MAFPASPTNGQQAVVGNVTYQYSTTNNAWTRLGGTVPTLSIAGNVSAGNVYSLGVVSAVGNVTGSYIIGNGSQLTGLPAGYANSDVAAYLASGTDSSNIITTANIQGSYIIGNGSQLTGLPAGYANSNVAAYLASGNVTTDILTTGNISATGNITSGNIVTSGTGGNISGANYILGNVISASGNIYGSNISTTGNIISGNISTAGTGGNISGANYILANIVSASGNVTGSYILGNGSQLTGLPAGYANADVAAYLASGTDSSNIITTGNISGSYILGNGSQLTGLPAGYANSNVASYLASGTDSQNIITTANVQGGNFITTGTASIGGFTIGANSITSQGPTLTLDPNASGGIDGNVVVQGNLVVNGNMTYINSNNITTNDLTINMANNAATPTAANGGGIGVGPAGAEYISLTYNSASNIWVASNGLSVQGNTQTAGNVLAGNIVTGGAITATGNVYGNAFVTSGSGGTISGSGNITGGNILTGGIVSATGNIQGSYFIGNGSQLTGLPAGYANSNAAAYFASGTSSSNISITGNVLTTADVSATGNIYGNNITAGNLSIAGNVTSGNIVTAGTGGNISGANYILGNVISASGNIYGSNISTTGNIISGNIATAGTGGNISGANYILGNVISATGNVTGSYIIGNGSQLTGLPAGYANTDAAAYFASGTSSSNISITGNLLTTSYVSATGNVTGGNLVTAGGITATGNIVAGGVRTTTSASAPSSPSVGDMWFDTTINIIYRYTYDGASYFWEDFTGGSLTSNTSAIVNGTSNVSVYNTGNVTVGVSGVGNVAVVSPTTMTLAANLIPAANNVYSLGSPTAAWASVYLSANTLYLGTVPLSANAASNTLTIGSNAVVTADPTGTSSTTGNMQVVGNVTGSNLITGGSVTATGTITGGNLVTGNITVTGDTISSANTVIYIDPAATGNTGLVVINGNLQVNGNTTTINSNTVSINDLVFNVANNAASGSQANAGGLGVGPAGAEYATLLYNNSGNTWTSNLGFSSAGNVTGTNYLGTAVSVSGNITGGNLTTGIVSATGSIATLGGVTATGNVTGGNVAGTLLTGTLATAAQPNVTSVGTLTSVTSSGLISTTGNIVGVSHLGTTVSVSGNVTAGNVLSSTVSATGVTVGGTATLPGTTSVFASRITNIAESANFVAAAPSSTTNFYLNNGAVQYYTSNANTNFTLNFAFSSGTSLNSAMSVGDSVSATLLVTNGSTGYYASAFQIDGTSVTPKWQGSAPTSGDASSIDSYTFVILKTASATYTVLASVTKFS